MDDFSTKIRAKKIKIESSLSDLNSEIFTCFNFLQRLKKRSAETVKDLNNVVTPGFYFRGFMDVNSYILKYLSLLIEINCKFEMLELSENAPQNIAMSYDSSNTSDTSFGGTDRSDSQLDFDENIRNNEGNQNREDSENRNCEPSDNSCVSSSNIMSAEAREGFKKKTEVSGHMKLNIRKAVRMSNIPQISYVKRCKNSENIYDSYSDISVDVKEKNITVDDENFDKSYGTSTGEWLNSDVQSKQISQSVQNLKETFEEEASADESCFTSFDSPPTMLHDENVTEDKNLLLNMEVPVAEVVPSKVSGCNDLNFDEIKIPEKEDKGDCENIPQNITKEKNEDEIMPVMIPRNVGAEHEITLEHIQSPSEFYVYVQGRHLNLFSELVAKLKNYDSRRIKLKKRSKADLSAQLGSYVLYNSKCDEMWCRAKVTSWCLTYKDDFIKIFLLDYGESKCVSIRDIEAMPESFKKYPSFATRCHLHGILSCEFDKELGILLWEKEATEKMISLTETSKKMKIKIAPGDDYHPENSLSVTLWLLDEKNECVNDLLVMSNNAVYGAHYDPSGLKFEGDNDQNSEIDSLNVWNPMREDFEAYENCYDLDINDPANYIYGYVGKDYERVCHHFASTGYCFKGNACKKEHKKLDSLGFTTDVEEVYKGAFNTLIVPERDSVIKVEVTCLLRVNKFCCILEDYNPSYEEESLKSLQAFMNNAKNIQLMKKLLIPPSTGQIVLANYSQDMSWYRAKILESQPESDCYTVLFVDYGNKETLPLSRIRAIEARYLHFPFQAVQCYIFGVRQSPEKSMKEAMDYFHKRITGKKLSIKIVAKLPGENTTLLVHLFDQNGENIGEDLKAKNYAVTKKEIIISHDSTSVPG